MLLKISVIVVCILLALMFGVVMYACIRIGDEGNDE